MINRDESELIAREQRNQREPAQKGARKPHVVSTPQEFTAVPAKPEGTRTPDTGFRTLIATRATRHAPR